MRSLRGWLPFPLSLASMMIVLAGGTGPVRADWDPGDGHKMHFPQLPDPEGWDVRISNARREPPRTFPVARRRRLAVQRDGAGIRCPFLGLLDAGH